MQVEVYNSSIKHHKLKRRVELKERKILEILKNHFGQFHKLKNDNSQLLNTSYGLLNLCKLSFTITTLMNNTFLCKIKIYYSSIKHHRLKM